MHQLVGRASLDDLATSRALRLRHALRSGGRSEVYGGRIEPALAGELRPLKALDTSRTSDVLIYHSGSGDLQVRQALAATRQPLVLVHSVGRRQRCSSPGGGAAEERAVDSELRAIRTKVRLAVALDAAAEAELRRAGFDDIVRLVLPLGIVARTRRRRSALTDYRTSSSAGAARPYFVALLSPTNRRAFPVALQAVSLTQRVLGSEIGVHSIELGPESAEAAAAKVVAQRTRIKHAHFHDQISAADLTGLIAGAAALVCQQGSESSLIALQAMAHDVPVIAIGSDATSEATPGMLVLPATAGAMLLAEALAEIENGAELCDVLTDRGRQCVAALQLADDTARLLSLLDGLG